MNQTLGPHDEMMSAQIRPDPSILATPNVPIMAVVSPNRVHPARKALLNPDSYPRYLLQSFDE